MRLHPKVQMMIIDHPYVTAGLVFMYTFTIVALIVQGYYITAIALLMVGSLLDYLATRSCSYMLTTIAFNVLWGTLMFIMPIIPILVFATFGIGGTIIILWAAPLFPKRGTEEYRDLRRQLDLE